MRFSAVSAFLATLSVAAAVPTSHHVIKPKVFIISMFQPEASVWYGIKEFNLLAHNITVHGFSPLFPDAHCTKNGEVCQLTTGESEINAATTISSLVASPAFDLTSTYFMVAGISGVNPNVATICGVSFARYAVQVALQYEIDAREMPDNFTSGYWAQGTYSPDDGLSSETVYGTEVFEVNDALRKKAVAYAKTAKLNDSTDAIAYRANYIQAAGKAGPTIYECDVATSDVYYSGKLLSDRFYNTTKQWTNGTGVYCATAQEDNATLEALLRGAIAKKVDFSRIIIMRTFSDFDQPYDGEAAVTNLLYSTQGAFLPAIANLYLAGIKVVEGILTHWDKTYKHGVKPTNYVGDIFGSLGGTPDFGPGGATYAGFFKKRGLGRRSAKRAAIEAALRQ